MPVAPCPSGEGSVVAIGERRSSGGSRLVKVARVDQVGPGCGIGVRVADLAVALFNVAGRLHAIDGSCVRCGAPLAGGPLDGTDLRCPGCGWHYDLATGRVAGVPGLRVDTWEPVIENADILLPVETPPDT